METKIIIPPDAVEEITDRYDTGLKKSAFYSINGEKVGRRFWDEDGSKSMEYGLKNDKMHGGFLTWHENGKLSHESYYIDGKEHGIAKQYDWDGNLIGSYEMHHGTGVDLWYSDKGILSEERHYLDGDLHGYERWWDCDGKTVWSEKHYKTGVEHGIFREWNNKGNLRRGFPQYFVNGEKVTKKQYLKICDRDSSLPKFVRSENDPERNQSITP